jgi:hypothetical protein
MTVIIKRGESFEVSLKKIERMQKLSSRKKNNSAAKKREVTFKELCGSMKGFFKEDALSLQQKWRSEWERF